jgi:diguanylate cyclase (GGDEF)-like protein
MAEGRRRCVWYAAAGVALSALAPVGLLVLREAASPRPVAQEIFGDRLTYAYVFIATAVVLASIGFVLGRQADRLVKLSATDPLTGLLNRRAFRQRLAEELQRSMRYGTPLSLMLVDLDGLKKINDEQGHVAGDRALRCVAAAVTHALRGSDFGARWGGDEFAIVTPNTVPAAALNSAERLVARVRERGFDDAGAATVTISVGIASFDLARSAQTDIDELVRAADDALYRAKARGPGGVRTAEQVAGRLDLDVRRARTRQ